VAIWKMMKTEISHLPPGLDFLLKRAIFRFALFGSIECCLGDIAVTDVHFEVILAAIVRATSEHEA